MKIHPPPTARSTASSKGTELVSVVLETGSSEVRLICYGPPVNGVRTVKEWRFNPSQPPNGLLDEVGATVEDVAITALLSAIGWPLRLPLDGAQLGEPPKAPTSPY